MAFFIVYNTGVGILFEISENERFKFLIEPMWWLFALTLGHRFLLLPMQERPAAETVAPLPVPAPALAAAPIQATSSSITIAESNARRRPAYGLVVLAGGLLAAGTLTFILLRQRKTAG
jgi:hypothetical protein